MGRNAFLSYSTCPHTYVVNKERSVDPVEDQGACATTCSIVAAKASVQDSDGAGQGCLGRVEVSGGSAGDGGNKEVAVEAERGRRRCPHLEFA